MKQPFNYESIRIDMSNCGKAFKGSSIFPYDTGNLKKYTHYFRTQDGYCIKINSVYAPYAEALENGSKPHDIPNSFGRGYNYGIGGRFDGYFHPGSTKHMNFIEQLIETTIIPYYESMNDKPYNRESWIKEHKNDYVLTKPRTKRKG